MKHLKDKYTGSTFAEAASLIDKKYKNRKTDITQAKSYEMEISELMRMNETSKAMNDADTKVKEVLKCGGKLKMAEGDFLTDPFGSGVPAGNTAWMAQQSGMPLLKDLGIPAPISPLGAPSVLAGTKEVYTPPTLPTGVSDSPLAGPVGFQKNPQLSVPNRLPSINEIKSNIPTQKEILDKMKKGVEGLKPTSYFTPDRKPGILQRLFGEESNIYNPAYAGQIANLGINAVMLAGGYDKEQPQTNKYESDVRRLMQERGIDNTAIQNRIASQAAAGRENLQNVRSANVRNALDQNLAVGSMEQSANAELQAQQMRNQYTGEYANVINNLGIQDAQARVLANELTARNKGQFQTNLSQFGQNVAENSKFFTKLKANDRMNELYTQIINQSAEDFGVPEGLMTKIKKGTPLTEDDIITLKRSGNQQLIGFAEFYTKGKDN